MLGVQVTVSLDSVSHQLYGNSNHCMQVHSAGVQYMRDHPERFVESNTENSWLGYLNNMCIQGIWANVLIVQAVANALNASIQIVESNPGYSPITTVNPVQESNSLSTITVTCDQASLTFFVAAGRYA